MKIPNEEKNINVTEVNRLYEMTQTKVIDSWASLNATQQIMLGQAIEEITNKHKSGLAKILEVDLSTLPTDSSDFKKEYESKVRSGVLSEKQKNEIEKLSTMNKIMYIEAMKRIFGFK